MIQLVTIEDVKDLFSAWEKINDRTKIHTTQIRELQREVKELKKNQK